MSRYLRPDLSTLEIYTPIKPLEVLAEEIGVPIDKLIKLDANENLYGPIQEVKEAITNSNLRIYPIIPIALLLFSLYPDIYPDPSQTYLRNALSKYMNLPAECLVAGTGSDGILNRYTKFPGIIDEK